MGVEGGTISGIGGPVGGAGIAISAGPVGGIGFSGGISASGGELGPIGSIGPSMIGPESFSGLGHGPVNEGPVAANFLENSVPLTVGEFNPTGEIMLNPFEQQSWSEPLESAAQPLFLRQAVEVAAAAWEAQIDPFLAIRQAEILAPEQILIRLAEPMPKVMAVPELVLGSQVGVQPEAKSKVAQAVSVSVSEELQIEPVVKKVLVKQIHQDQNPQQVEEMEEFKLKDVVDEEVLVTRIDEFGQAIDQVESKSDSIEAKSGEDEEIDGSVIVELLLPEDEVKRAGLVKKRGPDGSRVETIEEIAAKKFSSAKEAREQIIETIYQKLPVKKAKEGREVRYEDKARVLKYQTGQPISNQEQVEIRKVRLEKQIALEPKGMVTAEPTIADLGLEELYPKAA